MSVKIKQRITTFFLVVALSTTTVNAIPPTQVQAKTTYVYVTQTGKLSDTL